MTNVFYTYNILPSNKHQQYNSGLIVNLYVFNKDLFDTEDNGPQGGLDCQMWDLQLFEKT